MEKVRKSNTKKKHDRQSDIVRTEASAVDSSDAIHLIYNSLQVKHCQPYLRSEQESEILYQPGRCRLAIHAEARHNTLSHQPEHPSPCTKGNPPPKKNLPTTLHLISGTPSSPNCNLSTSDTSRFCYNKNYLKVRIVRVRKQWLVPMLLKLKQNKSAEQVTDAN